MSAEIQTLIELQAIDRQLYALEKTKGDLPQLLEEIKHKLAGLGAVHEQKASRLAAVEQERRSLEGTVSLAKERKKKYSNQLYEVKTNKEYDAITLEIENTEKEIDKAETGILEALDEEEKLKAEIEEYAAQIKTLEQERDQQADVLNRLMQENKSQSEMLANARQNLVGQVNLGLLRAYDRILKGKDGEAVVTIVRGSCGGCSTRIPPQRAMEIREMREIYYCDNCGRILVGHEEEAAVVPA